MVDDDEDGDDGDELFLRNGWPSKGVKLYFQLGSLSVILTIANLHYAASRIWTVQSLSSGFIKWSCAVAITTIPRLLQVLWNKHSVIDISVTSNATTEKMDSCDWCRQITDFFQYIYSWNQGVSYLVTMKSPCYNSCSAKIQ